MQDSLELGHDELRCQVGGGGGGGDVGLGNGGWWSGCQPGCGPLQTSWGLEILSQESQ